MPFDRFQVPIRFQMQRTFASRWANVRARDAVSVDEGIQVDTLCIDCPCLSHILHTQSQKRKRDERVMIHAAY